MLPEAAELSELSPALLAPKKLPGLWTTEEISARSVADYFNGSTLAHIEREGYQEPIRIPKVAPLILDKAIQAAVENGTIWLLSGPASILAEPLPPGVLTAGAKLCAPPAIVAAADVLPENLPAAWKEGTASGLSIATGLSIKVGKTLPWKTTKDVISAALQARFLQLAEGSQSWPCDFPSAQFVKFRVSEAPPKYPLGPELGKVLSADAELQPSQIQDLGDIVSKLLDIKAKYDAPLRFHVRIEMGDGKNIPSAQAAAEANALLRNVDDKLNLK